MIDCSDLPGHLRAICDGTSGMAEEKRQAYLKLWEGHDMPQVPPKKTSRGPGTELKNLIPKVFEDHSCGCKSYAAKMDGWGIDGCEQRFCEIVEHLIAQAKARHIPELLSRPVARRWLRRAIDNASRAQPKTIPNSS